jgi:CRP/FNR family transcriptional regulator, cyclic AMP receptor protein
VLPDNEKYICSEAAYSEMLRVSLHCRHGAGQALVYERRDIAMSWIDFLGYAASATVLATFCMTTMIPLRVTALVSNILFSAFGAWAHIYPVMILHLILFPVNAVRLVQIRHLVRGITSLQSTDLSIEKFLPFMAHRRYRAGDTLIRKGERADRLFYLAHGQVKVVEIDKTIYPGTVLGEIGVFARDQTRMATVVCVTDCEVYELTESKAKELYFQDPSFGYAVIQIIIARLVEDVSVVQSARESASTKSATPAQQG